jgi:hypothetical protein
LETLALEVGIGMLANVDDVQFVPRRKLTLIIQAAGPRDRYRSLMSAIATYLQHGQWEHVMYFK